MTHRNAPAYSEYAHFIGIPYREPDSEPDAPGMNCWELCERVMIEVFGIVPPKYNHKVNGKAVAPVFVDELSQWKQVDPDERKAGDLVLLNVAGYPVHLGILIDSRRMIHTLRNTGSSCEFVDSTKWKRRVSGYYRWGAAT